VIRVVIIILVGSVLAGIAFTGEKWKIYEGWNGELSGLAFCRGHILVSHDNGFIIVLTPDGDEVYRIKAPPGNRDWEGIVCDENKVYILNEDLPSIDIVDLDGVMRGEMIFEGNIVMEGVPRERKGVGAESLEMYNGRFLIGHQRDGAVYVVNKEGKIEGMMENVATFKHNLAGMHVEGDYLYRLYNGFSLGEVVIQRLKDEVVVGRWQVDKGEGWNNYEGIVIVGGRMILSSDNNGVEEWLWPKIGIVPGCVERVWRGR